MNQYACAITGHRPTRFCFGYNEEDPLCQKLKECLLEQQGQTATARRWVQRALSLRPNDPELLRRLAILEERLGVASTVAAALPPLRHEPE